MSFSIDIQKYANKTKRKLSVVSRAIKISLFNGVIRDTRVDTGRLRGNWQTSTNQPNLNPVERFDKLSQGSDGGKAQAEVRNNVKPFSVDYLSNNLPYAAIWEERDGMIAKNLARIDRTIKEEISDAT